MAERNGFLTLALDTSTSVTAAALLREDTLIGEFNLQGGHSPSERIMDMVKAMFSLGGVDPGELDLVVAGVGPGSFTGLRIGVSVVRMLSQTLNIPALGVSTLEAMALGALENGVLVPMIDARRQRVYTGIYTREPQRWSVEKPDSVVFVKDLEKLLSGRKALFLGPGVSLYEPELEKIPGAVIAGERGRQVHGEDIARLGRKKFLEGERQSLYRILPNYVRKSQAEREKDSGYGGD